MLPDRNNPSVGVDYALLGEDAAEDGDGEFSRGWYHWATMQRQQPAYQAHIMADPEILAGKPVIRGTRIPVALVLEYLANNPNFDEFFADYPELTMADVQACLAYGKALVAGEPVNPAPRRPGAHKALHHAV